jgi:hypothetical protein
MLPRIILCLFATAIFVGCTSFRTTGVSFSFDLSLESRGSSPMDVVVTELARGRKSLKTSAIGWDINIGADELGGSVSGMVTNYKDEVVCLRFSEASISGPSGVTRPLTVRRLSHFPAGEDPIVKPKARSTRDTVVSDSDICIKAKSSDRFHVAPSLNGIFDQDTMFNVKWNDETRTTSNFTGQYFVLELPISSRSSREILSMRFSVKEARWISSYH